MVQEMSGMDNDRPVSGQPTGSRLLMVVEFAVLGRCCYLSHQETMTLFERALVRSQIALVFSEGFNPRPRLTLPLPRSVGVQSECELLCVQVYERCPGDIEGYAARLRHNMPEGITIKSLRLMREKTRFRAVGADYTYLLNESQCDRIGAAVERVRMVIDSGQSFMVTRYNPKKRKTRQIDLGAYLCGVEAVERGVRLTTRITQQGAVRVDEWMQLLEITRQDLAEPVRRSFIEWEQN